MRFGQWNLFCSAWDWSGPRTGNQKAALLGLQNLWCNFASLNTEALHHAIQYEKASACIHKSTWRTAFSLGAAWMLICKHHELTSGVSTEASGWRRLALSPRGCRVAVLPSVNCCLCLVTLEGKWRLWNSREVGKTTTSYRAFVVKCLLTLFLYSQESQWQKKILTFH